MVQNGLAYGGTEKAKKYLAKESAGSSIARECGRESRPTVANGKQLAYSIQELFDAGLEAEQEEEKGKKREG